MGNHTSDHSSRCTVLEVDMQEWLLKCGKDCGVDVDEWVVTPVTTVTGCTVLEQEWLLKCG